MQEFFAVLGYVIAGGFAAFGIFSKQKAQSRTDNDNVAANLINNLKTTVDQQEKTISILNLRLEQNTKELHQMQGRNSVLEGLFKGNENSILAFLKQAPDLMEIAHENNGLAKEQAQAITNLTNTMNSFVESIRPLVEKVMENK